MTTLDLTHRAATLPARLAAGLAAGLANLGQHVAIRRRVARLRDLDDHLLDDIGLNRDDVETATHLPFGRNPAEELLRLAQERRRNRDAVLRAGFRF